MVFKDAFLMHLKKKPASYLRKLISNDLKITAEHKSLANESALDCPYKYHLKFFLLACLILSLNNTLSKT